LGNRFKFAAIASAQEGQLIPSMRKEKARTPVGIAAEKTDEAERAKRSMTVGKPSDAKTMTNAAHKPNRWALWIGVKQQASLGWRR
jgi:hypothetical protein